MFSCIVGGFWVFGFGLLRSYAVFCIVGFDGFAWVGLSVMLMVFMLGLIAVL